MRFKTVMIFMLISVLGGVVLAQDQPVPANPALGQGSGSMWRHGRGPESVDSRLERLTRAHNLTDAQKQQLRPILEDEKQQAHSIRQDTALTPQQRADKLRELHQGTRARIETILTPEQRAMQPLRGNRRRGSPAAFDPQRRLANLDRRVKLTDEQKSKLQPIFEQEQKQLQGAIQDPLLTSEQQRAKIREIHGATRQQVMAVLTPEQQQQLRAERRGRRGQGK